MILCILGCAFVVGGVVLGCVVDKALVRVINMIKYHSGYCCCVWCQIIGKKERAMYFALGSDNQPKKRDPKSIIEDMRTQTGNSHIKNSRGFVGVTPFYKKLPYFFTL
jgi:hypothetical protein